MRVCPRLHITACGAGNFLNVAYARLREIETDIIVERRKRAGTGTGSLDVSFDQLLTIDKFYGIEINWWPAKIAETAMFLVDHQANRHLAAKIGEAPERLPITITATILHGNALSMNWTEVLPKPKGHTFIFGNPPFLGHATRTSQQAEELRTLWGTKDISRLDYVTGWHAQALALYETRAGEFAYVTTNSITQGDQPPRLFSQIFDAGFIIKFAHRTFQWDSQAPGQAAVHCVIIGFTKDRTTTPRLWHYSHVTGDPEEKRSTVGINPYLVDAPNVLVEKRNQPLSHQLATATFGNMPRDGGNLIIEVEEYDEVMADPIAAKYVRRYVGSRELIRGLPRWCLWLVDLDPTDLVKSPLLKQRVQGVKDFRTQSKAASTRQMAETPHLFGQRSQPDTDYVCVPSVVSETRRYFTAASLPRDVIASNLAFQIPDPDGFQFAILSSSMFIAWQKAVGGRLKSDLRFASTLTWNTFPLPDLDDATRNNICEAGQNILAARDLRPERSLAEHYNPLAMAPELIKAHNELDRHIDRVFGAKRRMTTEEQRQTALFETYQQLIQPAHH